MFDIILIEPEIPQNTGNIARTCAVTQSRLHLIEPLGFEMSDKYLKRSGMDYWNHVTWKTWPNWLAFASQADKLTPSSQTWFVECGSSKIYTDAIFRPGDRFVFGRETFGIPSTLCLAHQESWISIPMTNPSARSLNLSNCVAIVLFEAIRQAGIQQL